MSVPHLLSPGTIGPLELRNRLVRAGTGEALADADGGVTPALESLYGALADGGVGLIITGHTYVTAHGKAAPGQMGIDDDAHLAGLRRLTDAVHAKGGTVLAQLSHAGGQSRVTGNATITPSGVANPMTGNVGRAATPADVDGLVAAFAAAAGRAARAGFDGVHIHGANGYLLSEFASPLTNRRTDGWGLRDGTASPVAVAVIRAVVAAVRPGMAVTMKVGMFDAVPGGLPADGPVDFVRELVDAGLDAVEVSCNLMESYTTSIREYVGVGTRRAVTDLLPHRIGRSGPAEGYFVPWARRVREAVPVPVIVAGGLRSTQMMERTLADGDADFLALARPLIREPDLPRQVAEGRRGMVDCTSCNLCLVHQAEGGVRCWRVPRTRLLGVLALDVRHLARRVSPRRPGAARR